MNMCRHFTGHLTLSPYFKYCISARFSSLPLVIPFPRINSNVTYRLCYPNVSARLKSTGARVVGGVSGLRMMRRPPHMTCVKGNDNFSESINDTFDSVGLLGISALTGPDGFGVLVESALSRCHSILSEVISPSSNGNPPSPHLLRMLDDLSDTLCAVVDAAELIRNVHPDKRFVEAADSAYMKLCGFMQELNSCVPLYEALARLVMDAKVFSSLSSEEQRVAKLLKLEFERNGIHLPEAERRRIVQLQEQVTSLGSRFSVNSSSSVKYVRVPRGIANVLPDSVKALCRPGPSTATVLIPTDSVSINAVLKWVSDTTVRRDMFMIGNTCAQENLEVLDQLISTRHQLAVSLGFPSFAHLTTKDNMAKCPEQVEIFLDGFASRLGDKARKELEILESAKRAYEGGNGDIRGWDRPYYSGLTKSRQFSLNSKLIAQYFPLNRCLFGLNLVCEHLFDMRMVKRDPMPGEIWSTDVLCFDLIHSSEGICGQAYLDLFYRPGKFDHSAHFTVSCGRQLSDSTYQLPVVAVVTNFASSGSPTASDSDTTFTSTSGNAVLLSHTDVEVLFHEFGHALHSLLSRTKYHHLAGTRCAMDYVETPSTLMEHFAWDSRVIQMFSGHHITGQPLPKEVMNNLRKSRAMFGAMDLQWQLFLSGLDLTYFGVQPLRGSTTDVLIELQSRYTNSPYEKGTHFQTRFTHLVGYGAGYYSYLWSRVFSANLWHDWFESNPLSSATGTRFRKEILELGGSQSPDVLLQNALGDSYLSADGLLAELGLSKSK